MTKNNTGEGIPPWRFVSIRLRTHVTARMDEAVRAIAEQLAATGHFELATSFSRSDFIRLAVDLLIIECFPQDQRPAFPLDFDRLTDHLKERLQS